jgi:lipoprotein-anchoring transpeptidase ErfK/SrfK
MDTLVGVKILRSFALLGAGAALVGGALAAGSVSGAEGAETATTTTTATTAATKTTAAPAAATKTIAEGVSIGGIPVGGMTPAQAKAAVEKVYLSPVKLVVGTHHFTATPLRAAYAIGRTSTNAAGDIPLVSRLAGAGMQSYVKYLNKTFRRDAVDAHYSLKSYKLKMWPDVWGRRIDKASAVPAILEALRDPDRGEVRVPITVVKPQVTARKIGYAVVIDRGAHHLTLYKGDQVVRVIGVAVGQASYPTPTGHFNVVDKQLNPWWYPPASPWAQGEKPVPPGPGNPLGTRWMGISAPGVGMHGTPDDASIGYSASHGCIRMHVPDAEWLFERVQIGTDVYIVD